MSEEKSNCPTCGDAYGYIRIEANKLKLLKASAGDSVDEGLTETFAEVAEVVIDHLLARLNLWLQKLAENGGRKFEEV